MLDNLLHRLGGTTGEVVAALGLSLPLAGNP